MTLLDGYLGNPIGPFGMLSLPAIPIGPPIGGSGGMSPSFSRATVGQTKMSGGVTAAHRPDVKSSYQFQWHLLNAAKLDLLLSFYDGRQQGPYCFVDPSQSNYLPANVASLGLVKNSVSEWAVSGGAFAPSTAIAAPTGLISGVAAWTGATNAKVLSLGQPGGLIDSTLLPPILSGKSHRFGIYARISAGACTLTGSVPYGIGGSSPIGNATATAPGVVLSTSVWAEVSAAVASSFNWTTGDYLAGSWTTSSITGTPTIYFAAASMVYDDAAAASALNPWVSGIGVPRLVVPQGTDSPVGRPGLRDYTMTMRET